MSDTEAVKICVKVLKLTGEEQDIWLTSADDVKVLKVHIEKSWGTPALCQKLLVDGTQINDHELLKDISALQSEPVIVTLIVAAKEALAKLHPALRGPPSARLDALRIISRLNLTLDDATCTIVGEFLSMRDDWGVMEVAIEVLGKAAYGDECAINALLYVLRSFSHPFRLNALRALGRVAPEGHAAVCEVAFARATDRKKRVRLAAIELLARVAPKGNESVIDLANGLLQYEDGADGCPCEATRKAASNLLESVAGAAGAREVREETVTSRSGVEVDLDEEETKLRARRAFERIDLNGDGVISRDELMKVWGLLDPVAYDPVRLEHLFSVVDLDKNGVIDIDEFFSWVFQDSQGQDLTEAVCKRMDEDMTEEMMMSQLFVKFKPGKVGMSVDSDTGQVTKVVSGGQAGQAGVKPGMIIRNVGDSVYSLYALKAAFGGHTSYEVKLSYCYDEAARFKQ